MLGWNTAAAGIDPERVAELLVTPAGSGPGRRGSGYRISVTAVLTAAHVVRDAARVRVRFNADRPGEWMTEASVEWADASVDAAVLRVTPRPQDEEELPPVAFGRVAERDAVLACSAMGFPRFKLRNDPTQPLDDGSPSQYRDSVHAVGTIAVLSNRRQGTLEVSVPLPERDPDPERSPWEGMSGAAVFSGGRIIGLVAEHHRSDGLGRLAATRVDRWYERLAAEQLDRVQILLPALPAKASGLVDVVPPTPGELLEAGYTAQVRDIAPEQLIGREEELAALIEFCAGEERYGWWQGEPWAGKSALAAWFVLHPPAGVTIVSFFVTGRLAGQADSDAFTEAMVEQLAAVAGEQIAATATAAGRDRERRRLLDQAATRVIERGRRLLLVVDGLDEDEGAKPGSGKPSIASLLPKRPPESVRVLVTSRPHPGIPGDVEGDHPLRRSTPRLLTPSPHAQHIELRAKRELLERLQGDQLQVDVIGFITASGGGLTLQELAELTAEPEWALDDKLGSVFGRSLYTRALTDRPSEETAERAYLFAHETLQTIAQHQLARDLAPYRQRIDAWADTYRAQVWPETTPRYLLRPYGRLLGTRRDLDRLVDFATDAARHDRMLAYTYGDVAALAEIATAQQLLLAQAIPDLTALGRLAVYRDRLATRNQGLPIELPALWVRLGQRQRGEALARSIVDLETRVQMLTAMVGALAEVDQERALILADDAEQTARRITDPTNQAGSLAALAQALAKAGHWDRAEKIVRSITESDIQAQTLTAIVEAVARVDRDRALILAADAEHAAHRIASPHDQSHALRALAEALVSIDRHRALTVAADAEQAAHKADNPTALRALAEVLADVDRDRALTLAAAAEQAIRRIPRFDAQTWDLTYLAEFLADVDRDRALILAADAEQAAHRMSDPDQQASAYANLATAFAKAGLWNRAEQTLRHITNSDWRGRELRSLAEAQARTRQWDLAKQTAGSILDPETRVWALAAIVEALAGVDRDGALILAAHAEQTARRMTSPRDQSHALRTLAEALAGVDRDRALILAADAEHAAYNIADPYAQVWALRQVAEAFAKAGHWDHAENAARRITSPKVRAPTLAFLAEARADMDRDRAVILVADAERAARRIPDRGVQRQTLVALTHALANARHWDHAERAARRIQDHDIQQRTLDALAQAQAKAGHPDRAEQTARSITDSEFQPFQTWALRDVAKALANAGHWDQAEQIARSITVRYARIQALAALAEALAKARQWGRARRITHRITNRSDKDKALAALAEARAEAGQWGHAKRAARRITNPYVQAGALAAIVEALAKAGRWHHAEQILHHVPNPDHTGRPLAALAKAQAQAGRWELAEQSARSIRNPHEKDNALAALAKAQAQAGQWGHAEQTAGGITDSTTQMWTLRDLAKAQAEAGRWSHAEQTARSIADSNIQTWALRDLADVLAKTGQWDHAKQVARRITKKDAQAQAYALIAVRLSVAASLAVTGTGELLRTQACQLVAEILVGEHWLEALQPLSNLNPSGVVAIYEALCALSA